MNDLHLGHDDDGKNLNIHRCIRTIFSVFLKVGLLRRMYKLSNQKL
jgi:hypothetical protein